VELVTGVVASNMIVKQMPGDAPSVVPPGSIYWPIHEETGVFNGESVRKGAHDPDTYARRVVSDLVDGGGWLGLGGWFGYERPWIWRGYTASLSYYLWLAGCMWKGLYDSTFRRGMLDILKQRLDEQERQKTKRL
jgi:hypothetical protein